MDLNMNKIEEKRLALKLSRAQLAEKIGVTTGAVCHYENNIRAPRPCVAKKINSVLGTTYNDIYGD